MAIHPKVVQVLHDFLLSQLRAFGKKNHQFQASLGRRKLSTVNRTVVTAICNGTGIGINLIRTTARAFWS